MAVSGIQGLPLDVTVVGCYNLKDKEWISKQDPYTCLEYGTAKFRTRTCTDGGRNPIFQEKYVVTLIEGLRELNVVVWNSNTLTADDFIGNARIQLHKVLSEGYDDTGWPLQSKTGRYSGEVRLILHCSNAHQLTAKTAPLGQFTTKTAPSGQPPYAAPTGGLSQLLPQTAPAPYPVASPYVSAYPPVSVSAAIYPPSLYANLPQPAVYPCSSQPYPPPPASYPCHPQPYPLPPQQAAPAYYHPPHGSGTGIYPHPPY